MHKILKTGKYFEKLFDDCEHHNKKLADLFLNKEHELKPTSVEYDRMPGLQTYNDLYNIFEWNNENIKWLGKNIYNFINDSFNIDGLDKYLIHGWFNVLNTNETLPWHSHYNRINKNYRIPDKLFIISGHYMVDAEKSSTIYNMSGGEFYIPTRNGMCTIFDPNLKHRTDNKKDDLRISVAFDIVPNKQCTRSKHLSLMGDIK